MDLFFGCYEWFGEGPIVADNVQMAIQIEGLLVPEAEVNLGILNGSYRESGPSDFIAQQPLSALSGHL